MLRNMGELFEAVARYFGGEDRTEVQSITVKFDKRTIEHGGEGYQSFSVSERSTVTVHRIHGIHPVEHPIAVRE